MDFRILLLIFLGICSFKVNAACHTSCICKEATSLCESCVDINSKLSQGNLQCICNSGWYISSTAPFTCAKSIQEDETGTDISKIFDECHQKIAMSTKSIKVVTNSLFVNLFESNYVVSDISLVTNDLGISDDCLEEITTALAYKSPVDDEYKSVPADYQTSTQNSGITLMIPLIDLFQFAISTVYSDTQISQVIPLKLSIGHADSYIRDHYWNLLVYTNRLLVQTFVIEVNSQNTESDEGCIIVVDLDTVAQLCSDETCSSERENSIYEIGQEFIAKIQFADPSYTKSLELISVYLKDDQSKIINYTEYTVSQWKDNSLIVHFPLATIANNALIQIQMRIIDPAVSLRNRRDRQLGSTATITTSTANLIPATQTSKVSLSAQIVANNSQNQIVVDSIDSQSNFIVRNTFCSMALFLLICLII